MFIYQIENGKSGRKVTRIKNSYKWGPDSGKYGSFFTKREVRIVAKLLDLIFYPVGDCLLVKHKVVRVASRPQKNINVEFDGF